MKEGGRMWLQITVVFFVLLIWAIFFVTIQSARMRRKQRKLTQRFLHDEDEANSVRKQPLDLELFFNADMMALPPLPEGDPHKVERAAKRKMIRFEKPISNVELKKRYGRLQLEYLAHYEENFNDYLRCLTKWAEALKKEGSTADALRILLYAISLGSEFRNTYKFAADIYADAGDKENLEEFLSKAVFHTFRDPATANHVIAYIQEKITGIPS
jgi:tetratricopeptide (TPR) repeat protein